MPIHKKVNQNFFKTWSSEMTYVLGFIFADGNVIQTKRGTHFLSMYSMDKRLLQQIRAVMKSRHKLAKRNARSGFVYRVQIGSREMCEDLYKLGLVRRKSDRMTMPRIPHTFVGDFVRGYFDGDGNVWSGYTNKTRSRPSKTIQVAFTSASEKFLKDLLSILQKSNMGVQGGSLHKVKDKNCSRIVLSSRDSLKLYEIMYNSTCSLFLQRKKAVFEKYLKSQHSHMRL